MKVVAIAPGFYGHYIESGDKFEVQRGEKATWFVPVKQQAEPQVGVAESGSLDETGKTSG